MADKPCIVAFDEFQQICKYPEKNIEALLRSHIQHLSNVNFVFAGSERHLITEMFLSSAKPFYNSTKQVELYPIVPEEYVPFVLRWFHAYQKDIVEEDVREVYRLFEGNTYGMQRTFHEAFIKKHALLSASSVQAAIKKLLELDLVTMDGGIYAIPDHFLALYLRGLMGKNVLFES